MVLVTEPLWPLWMVPYPTILGWKNDLDIGHPFESIRVGLGILNRSRDDSRLSDW